MPNSNNVHSSASFAGKSSLNVRLSSSEEKVQIFIENAGGTEWDLLCFGGAEDNPHALAKLESLEVNFGGTTDVATLAGALAFLAEELAKVSTPTIASNVSRG